MTILFSEKVLQWPYFIKGMTANITENHQLVSHMDE